MCHCEVVSEADCTNEADITILIDASSRVTESNFTYLLDFVDLLIRDIGAAQDRNRFAVATFNTKTYTQTYLIDYVNDPVGLSYEVQGIEYSRTSQSNIAEALRMAREDIFTAENGDRPHIPNLVLLLTGGVSNVNRGLTQVEAVAGRAEGLQYFGVGIDLPDDTELKHIT